jgi:ubiquinone/menaquinone biosynthesis C-methylase UbiE
MNQSIESQRVAFEAIFSAELTRWSFHDTKDPLIRYLRDRRLEKGMARLEHLIGDRRSDYSVLVVCGGVGGEGTYFLNRGYVDVTNSDFSQNALDICHRRDPRLKTLLLNAESTGLPDNSFDLVVVQDGLHHLPRPVQGLNEMIRMARRGVLVLEPHTGMVARLIGTEWERHEGAVNYVFRWNSESFRQTILSQLLESRKSIEVLRLWDHNSLVGKVVSRFGRHLSLPVARIAYALLTPWNFLGNNFVGILAKNSESDKK